MTGDQWRRNLEFVNKLYSDKQIDQKSYDGRATINAKIKAANACSSATTAHNSPKTTMRAAKSKSKILPPQTS